MKISVKDARKHFYPNPTFDLIYEEAVANALDAGATKIDIEISIEEYTLPSTLRMLIKDNGHGFTDENFHNFSQLLLSQDKNHRGLGRLVFLQYFEQVNIESCFAKDKVRQFVFNDNFNGDEFDVIAVQSTSETYTKLEFVGCTSKAFKSYSNLRPSDITQMISNKFLPRFIEMKRISQPIEITVGLKVDTPNESQNFISCTSILTESDIPDMAVEAFQDASIDMLNPGVKMHYLISRCAENDRHASAMLCIDGRSMDLELISNEDVPFGYCAYFLLQSDFLDSKVNDSRQEIELSFVERQTLSSIMRDKIAQLLRSHIPEIATQNQLVQSRLDRDYPHLSGYIKDECVGLMHKDEVVKRAQEKFLSDQREVLEATNLSDEQYQQSLNLASRTLLQYILYRAKIIDKISQITSDQSESDIHNLIVPMQTVSSGETFYKDIYRNNAWLLDDKFMSYQYVLSDENIKHLIEKISEPEEKISDDLRPDIAFVFSDDVDNCGHKVDVVVVELKKRNTTHLKTLEVVEQLKQRARRLYGCYRSRIQRMWFFGIVDFDKETSIALRESWTPLFSSGTAFYKEEKVFPVDENGDEIEASVQQPVSMTLWSYDAFLGDAKMRNETFMRLLRSVIKSS